MPLLREVYSGKPLAWYVMTRDKTTDREWCSRSAYTRQDAEELALSYRRTFGHIEEVWLEPVRGEYKFRVKSDRRS